MKKMVSGILLAISFIGSIVTIYTDETVQNIAKVITMIALFFLVCFIIKMIWNFLTNWGRELKKFLDALITIKEQSNRIAHIDEIAEKMVELNEKLMGLDKLLVGMWQENTDFFFSYNKIWKKVKNYQEEIIEKLDNKSYFQYRTTDVTVQLKRLLDTQKGIDEIHIICFGRSGYGEVAQYIAEKNLPIKIKIIVCNPQKNEFIHNNNDIRKIKELIKIMHQSGADIYLSNIPPTIRASTVYIKENAIWSVMQSYQFQRGMNNCLELTRPRDSQDSLIVICEEHSSKRDFDGIVKCFESEFERLLGNSEHLKGDIF